MSIQPGMETDLHSVGMEQRLTGFTGTITGLALEGPAPLLGC